MLMKNAIDTKTLYGWYEDDNGAKLMTNGHLIIKLSGATLDYVGDFQKMNDKNNDKCFVDRMNDIIEVAKKGEYKTTVNIQDIKMFDRYNTDKKPFCIRYSDNSYIGFNPYYFNKLNILTGSNLLTITDNKCPMYFAGDDIECILLPVMLEKSYNADNYAVFLEELKGCYIQEENEKAKKAAEKKNTSVLSLEEEVTYNGFTMWIGGKQYFLMSNKKRVTDEITKDFLKLIAANTTINIDKISESDFKYIKNGINSATITKTKSYSYGYEIIRIQQKNSGENFYSNEYNKLLIYNADFVKICLDELNNIDMSSVKPNTVATDTETTETKTADNMSATNTDTANNDNMTDTNNRKKVLHGFYMTFKNRDIFVATNEDMKRRYIVQAFISEMINISNHLKNITEEKRNNILNDEDVLKETKKRITPATIEEIHTYKENHIRITSDNNNMIVNHSLNNFKTIIIDCFSANEGITPAQETALKFFKGISDTNNRTTETTQADARQDTRQTETPAHKSSNCLFVTVAKDIKPEKVAQLQNVANLPTLASIPTYSAYLAQKINDIVNTKRNTNNGKKAHGRTNGATCAECAGVLKAANTS